MKLGDKMREAIATRDVRALAKLVDWLRFTHGFRYDDVFAFARDCWAKESSRTLTEAEWESLMMEADECETESPS